MERVLLQFTVAKILVTGAAGFIGFHTTLAISRQLEYEVVGVDSMSPAHPTELTDTRLKILKSNDIEVVKIDLAHVSYSELLREIGKCDLILHLAAFPGVRVTKSQESQVLTNNVLSFETIADFANKTSARLVYASSSSVYGDSALISASTESGLKSFVGKGSYALSKWENERHAISLMKTSDLRSIGLRLFSVFGTYGREDMAYFKFANHFLHNLPIQIFGSLNDLRDYTPVKYVVDDVLEIIELFLTESNIIAEEFLNDESLPILNIGSGNPRTLSEILRFYEFYFHKEIEIIDESRLVMESLKTWSSNDKRDRILSPRDEISFESSLAEFLHWFEGYSKNG
jgi:UDP-glucuronate 4-epimerase